MWGEEKTFLLLSRGNLRDRKKGVQSTCLSLPRGRGGQGITVKKDVPQRNILFNKSIYLWVLSHWARTFASASVTRPAGIPPPPALIFA